MYTVFMRKNFQGELCTICLKCFCTYEVNLILLESKTSRSVYSLSDTNFLGLLSIVIYVYI
ncbi:unnamed protein product [Larinioides sclopetarius]|uniref:Uncharacterized protein n=1 Tax=Larinioides sclopetarius TaxID=280406 RepID=A0AAV1ZYX9_9ARAC